MIIRRYQAERDARYAEQIAALELLATYPLGSDSFQIGHGANYFAFFDRLGTNHYYFALEGDRVAAVGAGILRTIEAPTWKVRAWYLCDLKVHPDYRGRHVPLRMLSKAFLPNYLRCRRGYAISMNPGDGSPNRIVRLISNFRWAPSRLATTLMIFSLDYDQLRRHVGVIERRRGPVSFLSLEGKKDIILKSTGHPMPLLHAQFGPCADPAAGTPRPGSVHMFCAPIDDALTAEFKARGFEPSGAASVIHHGMAGQDWRFILTSDI
ncbi:MAG: GNAT family N-acetyltransferase [Deltaproteobacteria bacterium]|nr:GNAT family N-acetyltransferase [Deltaproteobacteria bacterium]